MIYKKQVKKHEEVWIKVEETEWNPGGEFRVQVCVGNSNYGRLYYFENDESGKWLDEKETAEAFKLFAEIWEANKDNHPFSDL